MFVVIIHNYVNRSMEITELFISNYLFLIFKKVILPKLLYACPVVRFNISGNKHKSNTRITKSQSYNNI